MKQQKKSPRYTSRPVETTKRVSRQLHEQSLGMTTTRRSVLSNGVRVLTDSVPTVGSFALGIWIDSGTRDEPRGKEGIAHCIEHMVFRRTATRTSRKIASSFESLGAYVNAFTSKEQTCYYVRALTPHFSRILSLLSDVVLSPTFDSRDVEKERRVILEEIKSYDDEPEELIMDIGERLLFGKHQLGSSIIGTAKSVACITADDVRLHHQEQYTATNIVIACAGNIDHDEIVRQVDMLFGHLPSSPARKKRTMRFSKTPKSLVQNRGFQQAHILMLRQTSGAQSPQKYSLSLLNTLLGDGMSSRLHQRIREKHGLAYSVYSTLQLLTDCGIIAIYAGTEEATLEKTVSAITNELLLLNTKTITRSELLRAKGQAKSGVIMGLESMSQRMQSLAKAELEEGIHEEVFATLQAIDSVTLDEINSLAATICNPTEWSSVRIHPEIDEEM